jgi:hypothetical protein
MESPSIKTSYFMIAVIDGVVRIDVRVQLLAFRMSRFGSDRKAVAEQDENHARKLSQK